MRKKARTTIKMNDEDKKEEQGEEFLDLSGQFEKQKSRSRKQEEKQSKKLEELSKEVERYKNEYMRLHADMQNLRKDIEKERREFIKYRISGFIEELLPVLDNFEMAFRSEPPSEETRNYLCGFKMIFTQLKGVLENEGVQEINPKVGDKFDHHLMEAVDVKKDKDHPDGVVLQVTLCGYKMHDRLIRPASVIVNKID